MREGRAESVRTAEATRFFFAWRKYPWNSSNPQRDSFLRVALSAKAPRPTRICCHLQIVVKYYRLCGGEGRIRTLETLQDSRGGIQSKFGALFGPNKSIRAGENLFALNSALPWISSVPFRSLG